MDYSLTPEQEAFRKEVCDLLSEDGVRAEAEEVRLRPPGAEPGMLEVYRRLGERRWLAVNWPAEYGGLGRGVVEKSILTEELIRHGVPDLVHVVSVDIVGLIIQLAGTPEQRRRLLPPLARGESSASVLYSEPGAGSDLAALRTRAEPDGDGAWRLYGRKVYSLKSQFADWALCAARTSESEAAAYGITLFVVPLRTPGVTVRPLPSLSDDAFGDVTLEGVRLTRDDVLGPVDEGYQVITEVIPVERTGLEFQAKARRLLDLIVRRLDETGGLDEPGTGQRLVRLHARARAAELLSWRVITELRDGRIDGVHAAMAKWYATELFKELTHTGIDLLGLDATLTARDRRAPCAGVLESGHRDAPGYTLSAGTSEIMQYLIASTGLGLLT
ncbi:acyl-CoA dehydrogenase family protein [Actinomadura macra]|uniref:acyl-CoA dehydrogenase family protein n=1 Tax=Actinomadura macra TaxID=46164 RepID=UPI0008348A3A|nr:acyl-CoA dehydrogenase family protein [Actinomadura macra]